MLYRVCSSLFCLLCDLNFPPTFKMRISIKISRDVPFGGLYNDDPIYFFPLYILHVRQKLTTVCILSNLGAIQFFDAYFFVFHTPFLVKKKKAKIYAQVLLSFLFSRYRMIQKSSSRSTLMRFYIVKLCNTEERQTKIKCKKKKKTWRKYHLFSCFSSFWPSLTSVSLFNSICIPLFPTSSFFAV